MNFAYMNMNSFIYNISTCIMYASSNLCYAVLCCNLLFFIFTSQSYFYSRLGLEKSEKNMKERESNNFYMNCLLNN